MTGPSNPDAVRPPDPRMIAFRSPPPLDGSWRAPHRPAPPPVDPTEVAGDAGVRPFVITGGRTTPVDQRLRIETQVVATPNAHTTALSFERYRIVELCRTPLAVAEIAAALGLPLGVARVLVADLAVNGLVTVHKPVTSVSRTTIERILERVHAL